MRISPYLKEIQQLDPLNDHQRIVHLSSCYEFPWDHVRAMELAFFRTFSVPSISRLLNQTGEFPLRPQKRYDDTDLIMSELVYSGYDSPRGRAALRRMNQIHRRFQIANGDFLYVLSTFVFEPVRWNARFGWRSMTETEKLAGFYFWREVGMRMGIRDIPESYAAFERYNVAYEQANFRYADANQRVSEAVRDMFLSWFAPSPLHPLGRPFVHALLDERLLAASGFSEPPAILRRLLVALVRLRGRAVRLLPPRRKPVNRTTLRHRSYPDGYRIEDLGPVPMAVRTEQPISQ
jgi:hypothetical protein